MKSLKKLAKMVVIKHGLGRREDLPIDIQIDLQVDFVEARVGG